jgi:hypothetical protein
MPRKHRHLERLSLGRRRGSAAAGGEARERAQRRAGEAASLARVPHIAREKPCDDSEDPRRTRGPKTRCRAPVEHTLGSPGRAGVLVESGCKPTFVRLEITGEDRLRGKLGRDPCLVDAVAGKRIDEPGRVADEQHAPARGGRAEPAHREPMAP